MQQVHLSRDGIVGGELWTEVMTASEQLAYGDELGGHAAALRHAAMGSRPQDTLGLKFLCMT